ncbi:hypothetical protein PLAN_30515 [Planktothrix rubescens CCAP 1459/22]|uniref:Uncharacterized protein n=1 Tax=Planktothrix rubescens CCAP 1459/22 TaxID=329571 RepID=A0A6J7ZLE4_PLARU|nr:hypothetical protein PLAN_30515 [Planktothrix rubescens NIVA-CYA 18]
MVSARLRQNGYNVCSLVGSLAIPLGLNLGRLEKLKKVNDYRKGEQGI